MSIFDLFKKIETTAVSGPPTFIVVGLGNPGKKYDNTRHNAGFRAIDHIAAKLGAKIDRAKFDSLVGECEIGEVNVLLMKPQTLMNASGTAVSAAADFYKISPEHIIILSDDASLEPGHIRIRREGSAGGHNGLKSINKWLGTEKYPRVKIGVGKKPSPEYDLADWVLGNLPDGDMKLTEGRRDDIFDAVRLIISGETKKAMNLYNRTEK